MLVGDHRAHRVHAKGGAAEAIAIREFDDHNGHGVLVAVGNRAIVDAAHRTGQGVLPALGRVELRTQVGDR